MEDAVAADALVEDAEVRGLLVGEEAVSEDVGPAGVGVAGAMGSVGDAVAEGDDRGTFFFGGDVDAFEEVPCEKCLGAVERGRGDCVARNEIVRLVCKGMKRELVDWLIGEKDADGEVRCRCDFEGYGIADDEGPGWDGYGWFSAEGERNGAGGGDG